MTNMYQNPMQPWPELAPFARRVELSKMDLSLYVYDTGGEHNTVTLLVHGLGDEADTWRHIVPSLSANSRILALDLPGFGRSDQPKRAYTVEFYKEALLALLDELGIERATWIGHSLGGMIVHSLALAHPERVAKQVLIGGSLVARTQKLELGTLLFMLPGVGEWLYTRLCKDPDAAYESLRPYYETFEHLPDTEREFLFQRVNERVWSDGQRRGFLSTLRNLARSLPALQKTLPEQLPKLTVPTLLIWGEHDRMNSPENGQALIGMQPGAKLVIVPGAGHNVHQEMPHAVLDAMQAGE